MYRPYSNPPPPNQRGTTFQTPYIGNRGAGQNGGRYSGAPHFRNQQQNGGDFRSLPQGDFVNLISISRVVRLEKHLVENLTRLRDLFERLGRTKEAEELSEETIQELSGKCGHWIIAAVTVVSHVYEESGLPQSENAKSTLVDWAQYIRCSFNKYQAPDLNDQNYETAKMERAKLAADEFWKAYQEFNSNPDEWIAQWLRDRRHQEFQQQERMSNARYLGWLQTYQPHRLPPPPAVSRLRADTPVFFPTTRSASGSGSPTGITETSPPCSLPEQLVNGLFDGRVSTDSRGTVASSQEVSRIDSNDSMDSQASQVETEESGFLTPDTDTSQEDLSQHNEELYRPDQAKKNRSILIFDAWRNCIPAGAILDTGNDGPNAISESLVLSLGFGRKIDETKRDAGQRDVNGNLVRVIGTVKLFFCFYLPGDVYTEYLPATFNVVKMDIQVLFGLPYLNKHGLITVNEPAMQKIRPEVNETAIRNMAPLTSNRKPTAEIKQAEAERERQRRERKAEAEAERLETERMLQEAADRRVARNRDARNLQG